MGLDQKDHLLCLGITLLFALILSMFLVFKHTYYSVLFMPERKRYSYRRKFAGMSYERKFLSIGFGSVDTLLFVNNPGNKIVFYCHGNGGSIGTRGYVIRLMTRFNLNSFLFDYRGYGYSQGKPTEVTFKEDALVAYDYLTSIYSPDDIIVWGESLGGAVATYVASQRKCHKLVVMSSFASVQSVLAYTSDINKFLKFGINIVMLDRKKVIPSVTWISKVHVPTIVIHSKEDDLIPYENGKDLYKLSGARKKAFISISGSHAAPVFKSKDFKSLYTFLFDQVPTPDTNDFQDVQEIINDMT